MKNFSGIVAWYSADRILGLLSCSSNISISLILILNSKIALVFETEMLNWTANEESLQNFGRFFILELLCGYGGRWFCLRKVFWDQYYNSTFLLFLTSSVMILLTFLSCFLVFFFVKDQIASFQLKQIIVFLI